MQLYALDQVGTLISAKKAEKQQNYFCMECQARVRVRGGFHRQAHFFHFDHHQRCHLSGKGMVHLQVQQTIAQLISEGQCQLEYRFPEIKRIADVAWIPQRIIFEVQCAPISAQEIEQRNQDYSQLGWEVVWILHDARYNQRRLTAAEMALQTHTHYFTNVDQEGQGIIYDQFCLVKHGVRIRTLPSMPIAIISPSSMKNHLIRSGFPDVAIHRLKHWTLYFGGDLVDVVINRPFENSVYVQMKQIEQQNVEKELVKNKTPFWKKWLYRYVGRPYLLLMQMLLEKSCR